MEVALAVGFAVVDILPGAILHRVACLAAKHVGIIYQNAAVFPVQFDVVMTMFPHIEASSERYPRTGGEKQRGNDVGGRIDLDDAASLRAAWDSALLESHVR